MLKEINIKTSKKFELIDVTEKVKDVVKDTDTSCQSANTIGDIKEGICVVYTGHATGAIMINESADPELKKDILDQLNKLVPEKANYRHDRIDDNAQAHIKAGLIGASESIPIKNGKIQLGTWQAIMFCEFDGPRPRKILVQVR